MAEKLYNNGQMVSESSVEEVYFFPDAKTPTAIKARSREEAEAKLLALTKEAK